MTGIYKIYAKSWANTEGYLYDAKFQEIAYNDDAIDVWDEDFSILYPLNAGETYYVKVKCFFLEEIPEEIGVGVYTIDQISQMQLDVPFEINMISNHAKVLQFIPAESGTYYFSSELLAGYYSIHGELYDSKFRKIGFDKRVSSEGFEFSVDLTAGETYYFYTTFKDKDYWEGTYNVIVKSIENRATSIQIKHDGPVTGYVGEEYTLTAELKPEGCIKENIIWKSSDETIATVREGIVTFLSAGSVAITAKTERTGLEDTVEIVVNEIPVIEVGDDLEVTIDTEEKINYKFIPAESGYYKIHVSGDKEYPATIEIINKGFSSQTSSSSNSFTTEELPFVAGEIYSVKARYENGEEGVFNVRFQKVLSELSPSGMKWWIFREWHEEMQYRFIPEESGIYSLLVMENASSSYILRIYDENLNMITEGYDDVLSYYYEEGKTYYLGVHKCYGGRLAIRLKQGVAIDKLEIETLPTTVYFEGVADSVEDWFEGLKLKATLADGTILYCEPYPSGYFPTIAGFTVTWEEVYNENNEIQEIIITCGGKEVKIFPEKIENPVERIEVAYDEIDKMPVLIEKVGGFFSGDDYIYGTSVFHELPIRIFYKDGTSDLYQLGDGVDGYYIKEINDQYINPWAVGSNNYLTISYAGQEVKVPVTIIENQVDCIELVTAPTKEYVYGDLETGMFYANGTYWVETIDLEGLVLQVHYKDGSYKQFTSNDIVQDNYNQYLGDYKIYVYTLDEVSPNAEQVAVLISYLGYELEYSAKVINKSSVSNIEVIAGPRVSVYDVDYLCSPDFTGMKIKITYTDNTSKVVELTENNLDFVFNDGGEYYCTFDDGTKMMITYVFEQDAYCTVFYQGAQCTYEGFTFEEKAPLENVSLLNVSEDGTKLLTQFVYEDGALECVELSTMVSEDRVPWARTNRGIIIYGIEPIINNNGNIKGYTVDIEKSYSLLFDVEPDKIVVEAKAMTEDSIFLATDIEGTGTYETGATVTVMAEEKQGYNFLGWYELSEDGNSYVGDVLSTEFSYMFVAEADRNLVAVYKMVGTTTLKVNGAQFKVNDGITQLIYNYTQGFNVGTEIKLTATGENFAYWMNESNKIVSTEREYTFTLSQPTIITVVYKNAVEGDAFVEFVSDYDQVLQAQNYSATSKILLPNGPSKSGHVFKNWSMTVAEIKAAITEGETYIRVTPVYEKVIEYFDVTVVYDGNIESALVYQDVLGYDFLQLTPRAIEGRKFAYWSDALTDGNVLSTSDTYSLYVNKDITVYAIYVDVEEEVEVNPIIAMTNAYTSEDASGTKKVHFEATRNIPEGYTLQEHGVIYSTSSSYGEESAEDTMIIGASDVNKNIAKTTGNEGIYVLNVSIGTKVDTTIFARGYMILKNNATGESETFYSQIMSGSYNSLQ